MTKVKILRGTPSICCSLYPENLLAALSLGICLCRFLPLTLSVMPSNKPIWQADLFPDPIQVWERD